MSAENRDAFASLVAHLRGRLRPGERFTASLTGEDSDFVRFNRGQVRQPGTVTQRVVRLRWIRGLRHATVEASLGGEPAVDRAFFDAAIDRLRERLDVLPEDPHLLLPEGEGAGEVIEPDRLPDAAELVEAALAEAGVEGPVDMVGILARGPVHRGFADDTGRLDWFSRSSFYLDWSLVQGADRAVKSLVAGFTWDRTALARRMAEARARLAILGRPVRRLAPGDYRVFLTPTAVGSIFELLAWDAFSERAIRAASSPLQRLVDGRAGLSPAVSVFEEAGTGLGARFQSDGFVRPDRVPLIEGGRWAGALISPRTAREHGLATNGAEASESPNSLVMAPGDLREDQILERLGTGLWVSNLWYLNHSDRATCRMTGMTRFATLWVEDGEIVAPAEVMRFDDSLYRIFGDALEGLTDTATLLPSTDTYVQRSTGSMRVPGALLSALSLTL